MRNMASLSSGNAKALKKDSGVSKWVSFCKIMCQMIFLMMEENPSDQPGKLSTEKKHPKKNAKTTKKLVSSKNISQDSEGDFVPFTQKTPPPPQAKKVAPKKNPFVPSDLDDDFVHHHHNPKL